MLLHYRYLWKKIAINIKTRKVITYGINKIEADLNIVNISTKNDYSFFLIKINKNKFPKYKKNIKFILSLLGKHNVLNATASIAVGLLLQLPINKIQNALKLEEDFHMSFIHKHQVLKL